MTAPGPSTGSSALRIGGFALIGLAVLAAIIGLAALAGSGDGGSVAAPTQTTVPSSAETAVPTSAVSTPPTTSPVATPTGPSGPTATAAPVAPPAGAAAGAPAARAPLRVYNNSTISGLADQAAADFRAAGWSVTEVGNYPSGIIPTSTVYFRLGTGEEAPARALGSEFGLRVEPRFEGLASASPGLIVIATRDYQRR